VSVDPVFHAIFRACGQQVMQLKVDSLFIIAAVITLSVLEGTRHIRTDAKRVRSYSIYRLIREIFVPSMLTPAINPC